MVDCILAGSLIVAAGCLAQWWRLLYRAESEACVPARRGSACFQGRA